MLAVRRRLNDLEPTGGMLALPAFNWKAIYTTNFDQLVEKSYKLSKTELNVVRTNYEFSTKSSNDNIVPLYKIHGCISKDIALGDHAQMVLTEVDYEDVEKYRQALFSSLQLQMISSTTLIIGQSLTDAHLRDLAKTVGSLRMEGVPGRIYLLVYDYDPDRAKLLEQRGIQVAAGTLEDFLFQLGSLQPPPSGNALTHSASSPGTLPPSLATTTIAVDHASGLTPNIVRLFNGSPGSYADIHHNFTIQRHREDLLFEAQNQRRGYFLVLSGAAGVGKTTLARRLMYRRHTERFVAWEHQNDYPLDVQAWLNVEASLRSAKRQGMLLIDDCARNLGTVNRLVDGLGKIDRPFLRLVVTVNTSQWKTRPKSPFFFSRGTIERLSSLAESDLRSLINLVDRKQEIRNLVEDDFLRLGFDDKIRRLRERCSSEMYVCLKNIFQTEQLDTIVLREFAELDEDAQKVYRYVAAIQAMGGKVHRQLVLRLLQVEAGGFFNLLGRMEDVVSEYDIKPKDGLYGLTTRHDVIAETIAKYKFADEGELFRLIERLIDGLNPTQFVELETARGMAAHEMGIQRLTDRGQREQLLRRLIDVVPAERTPRRRLIRLLLEEGKYDEADQAIRVARREIGKDSIIKRYQATLLIRRAETAPGLQDSDRFAMLLEAARVARECVAHAPHDRYNYRVLADVGIAMAQGHGKPELLDETIEMMRQVETEVADPDFIRDRRDLESTQRRTNAAASESPTDIMWADADD
ncbi:SIR2 family protein [Mycolicibacter heraklionensis]|nr:SIR2 family protein [Mycolicibacter heraklionensis]